MTLEEQTALGPLLSERDSLKARVDELTAALTKTDADTIPRWQHEELLKARVEELETQLAKTDVADREHFRELAAKGITERIAEAVAAEREACAKLVESGDWGEAADLAASIRARGNP